MSNFLEYETLIQKGMEKNRTKEVSFLIEYLIKSSDKYGLNWYSLMQDIP